MESICERCICKWSLELSHLAQLQAFLVLMCKNKVPKLLEQDLKLQIKQSHAKIVPNSKNGPRREAKIAFGRKHLLIFLARSKKARMGKGPSIRVSPRHLQ